MIRQSWTIILFLGVGLLMGGCAGKTFGTLQAVKVTYTSNPPGASLYEETDGYRVFRGELPVVLEYKVRNDQLTKKYINLRQINAEWPSGATAKINPRLYAKNGALQHYVFTRPDVEGLEQDLQFARKLEQQELERKELEARKRQERSRRSLRQR